MFFISSLKLFVFLRYLNSCSDLLVTQKNGLIRKPRLTSKFGTLQPGKQTITIHILPNISRSKDNKTMRLSQLIEYNMRNIFFLKFISEPFLKHQNWAYLWLISSLKSFQRCFECGSIILYQQSMTKRTLVCSRIQFFFR